MGVEVSEYVGCRGQQECAIVKGRNGWRREVTFCAWQRPWVLGCYSAAAAAAAAAAAVTLRPNDRANRGKCGIPWNSMEFEISPTTLSTPKTTLDWSELLLDWVVAL